MFKNPGTEIKNIVQRAFALECVAAVVLGVLVFASEPSVKSLVYGILLALFLIGFAYVSKIILYAFGQLVENSDIMAGRLTLAQVQAQKEKKTSGAQETTIHQPRPVTVRVVCGSCGCEYPAEENDGKACPNCGGTQRTRLLDDR